MLLETALAFVIPFVMQGGCRRNGMCVKDTKRRGGRAAPLYTGKNGIKTYIYIYKTEIKPPKIKPS